MRISIELVPRDPAVLLQEAEYVGNLVEVDTINIPDLIRMDTRSWDACASLRTDTSDGLPSIQHTIPHLRSMDFDPAAPLPFANAIRTAKIDEIILVTGDKPQGLAKKVYRQTPFDLLQRIRAELPDVKVYAAVDPYRQPLRAEYDYVQDKRDAGFDGFFTQPFFDLKLMESYAEWLRDDVVFWGVSPVVAEGSRNYWETKNNVVFPRNFEPTLAWNIDFARQFLALARSFGDHVYFMPIRVKLEDYLGPLFRG